MKQGENMQNYKMFTCKSEIIGEMTGLVTLPAGYEKDKEKLPVIVFLHGAGERGANDDKNIIPRLATHGIPKLFLKDCEHNGIRAITLSPQCPENMIWDHLVFPLMNWIENAVEEFGGDKNRISITGISMGGYGTWDMITTFPKYFSCAAPVCGGGVSWRTRSLGGVKIWAFHGIDDDAVPVENSLEMVKRAKHAGAEATLTTFDHIGHGSWVPAYEQTDLVSWLVNNSL